MILKMLFVLFVGLKLADIIDWSWWLISLPAIWLAIFAVSGAIIKEAVRLRHTWAIKLVLWLKN